MRYSRLQTQTARRSIAQVLSVVRHLAKSSASSAVYVDDAGHSSPSLHQQVGNYHLTYNLESNHRFAAELRFDLTGSYVKTFGMKPFDSPKSDKRTRLPSAIFAAVRLYTDNLYHGSHVKA